jgi:hypothetical protein
MNIRRSLTVAKLAAPSSPRVDSQRRGRRGRVRWIDNRRDSDRGSTLILALIYLVVAGLTVLTLASLATTALSSTTQFLSVSQMQSAARSTTNVAVNSIRFTPLLGSNQTLNATPPSYCWGSSAPSSQTFNYQNGAVNNATSVTMDAWCATTWNPTSSQTRIVTIDTCPSSQNVYKCENNPFLQAQVTFDDYPLGVQSGVVSTKCNLYCGQGVTVDYFNWTSSSAAQLANSITVTSNPPASAQVGGAYIPTATATSGQSVVITSSSGCPITSGTVEFLSGGTCTINFDDPGSINYQAATQVTQTVSIALGTQTALTLATTSAASNGSSYSLVLSTNGGSGSGLVTYALDSGGTASGCAIAGGTLSAASAGTCVVTATKAADNSYALTSSAATSVKFSQTSQAAITIGATSLTSTTQNVSITGGSNPGGLVTYSTSSAGCSISGTTLSSTGGSCQVSATLAGNAYYLPVTTQQTIIFAVATSATITAADNSCSPVTCQVGFNVTVTGVINDGIPQGTLSVYQSTNFLCNGSIQSQSAGNASTAPFVKYSCTANLNMGTTYDPYAAFTVGSPSSSVAGITYTSVASSTISFTP